MRRGMPFAVGVVLAGSCTLVGCGRGAAATTTWVGSVTTLTPTLCVGRHDALGDCFGNVDPGTLATLHPGECVEVTFTYEHADTAGPATLKAVRPADASRRRLDCPPGFRPPPASQ